MSEPQTTTRQPGIDSTHPVKTESTRTTEATKPAVTKTKQFFICAAPILSSTVVLLLAILTQSALIGGEIFGYAPIRILRPVDLGYLPHLTGLTPAQIHGIDTARIGWVSTAFLHAIVCIGTIVSGLWIVFHGPAAKYRKKHHSSTTENGIWDAIIQYPIIFSLAGLAVAMIISIVITHKMHHKIADEVISIITTSEANASALRGIVFGLNCLTFTSAIVLISLGAIMLYTPKPYLQWIHATDNQPDTSGLGNDIPHYMAAQSQECKVIFYFGAAVLVTAIIRLHAFFGWAISYYPRESGVDATGLRHLLESIATTWGIFATLLLLAMYLPIYITLRHRSFHLVHRCQHGECRAKHRKWLKRNGFVTSNAQLLSKAAAMLSPFLVGQASELFKGI